jgi:VIT1/CCC1 family predicted Fe2+/Mn2+ transporter
MKNIVIILLGISLSQISFAAEAQSHEEKDSFTSIIYSCTGGAVGATIYFFGLGCSSGVCSVVIATSTSSVLAISGFSAAVSSFISLANESCEELSLSCVPYTLVPALIGGSTAYLLIKSYDYLRKCYNRR